jgi:hypothetical protein
MLPLGLPVAFVTALTMAAFELLRSTLPASACEVNEAQISRLQLEMRYDTVKVALGCDGVLAEREDYGQDLRMEVYRWRGNAWPYAVFSATFYNRVMHATEKRWLRLDLRLSEFTPEKSGEPPPRNGV